MSVKEYITTTRVTRREIGEMHQAQLQILDVINGDSKIENLQSALNGLSLSVGTLGMFLPGVGTVAGIVSAVSSVLGSYTTSHSILKEVVQRGCNSMGKVVSVALQYPAYDIFEITFPFLEYPDENLRLVQGDVTVRKVHFKNKGWIIYNH